VILNDTFALKLFLYDIKSFIYLLVFLMINVHQL